MASVVTEQTNIIYLKPGADWTKVIEKKEGFAYSDSGDVRVIWGDNKPDVNDYGQDMPSQTQVNNITAGTMWCRTDRYGRGAQLRVTTLEV